MSSPFSKLLKKSYWDNSFSQSSQKVMTEGFLKPNAKTAFFKAILNFKVIGLTPLGIKLESTAQETDALYHSAI